MMYPNTILINYLNGIRESIRDTEYVPLILVQGLQGCGKTYLCEQLQSHYGSSSIITLSLDDFYHPYEKLDEISKIYINQCPWYQGRGLPGTHDLNLLQKTLTDLRSRKTQVSIPRFDKSLRNGAGDRVDKSNFKAADASKLEMVVLEGWCLAFRPKKDCILNAPRFVVESTDELTRILLQSPYHLIRIEYIGELDIEEIILKWRWEQEVTRGQGMSKDNMKGFLERFYLYLKTFEPISPPNLSIKIDENRHVLN